MAGLLSGYNEYGMSYALTDDCNDHKRCDRIAHTIPVYTQATLISNFGQLSISRPSSAPRYHCTPAPHAVRRIANETIFSTNDASLTCFLRFPPEIRIQIYRLLLIYDGTIRYRICPVKLRLVVRNWVYRGKRLWIRHGIFPSILRCCRRTNQEGTDILYGENWFSPEKVSRMSVIGSWDLPKAKLDSITMVHFCNNTSYIALERRLLYQLKQCDLFLGLKQVKMECRDVGAWEWGGFLKEASKGVLRNLKLTFNFSITRDFGPRWPQTAEEYCRQLYQSEFENFEDDVWRKRRVVWEFEEYEDDISLEYISQVMALLRLTIE